MSNEVNNKPECDQSVKLEVSAKVFPVKDPKQEKGSILAFASAEIGGCFAVTGIKVVEGKDGPFVAMPNQRGKDKQHHDICFPTTAAMREAVNTVVMEEYRGALEQAADRAAQAVEWFVEKNSRREDKPSLRGALRNAVQEVANRPPQEGQRAMEQGAR